MRPIGIDLFAGAGGLSLGFEQAGFDVVAAVEIDPIHSAAHEFNFPRCKTICRSVVGLPGDEIRRLAAIGDRDVDVVFGGAPCQGFSMIGKRALEDPRNQLVAEFVRIVLEVKPKFFVFENVPGLTIGKHRQVLHELFEEFGRGGYQVREDYRVLDASEFGVPQSRRRLFLLGARSDQQLPSYPEPISTSREKRGKSKKSADGAPLCPSVADAISDLPEVESYEALLERDWVRAEFGQPSAYAAVLRGVADDESDFSYRRRWDHKVLTSSMRSNHTELSRQRFAATAHGDTEPVSRFRKLDPDGVCNTLRAGTASDRGAFTSPRPIHPFSPRCITVREAARLHSYPDWFRLHATKWHGFRQVGNSVPPLLARAVAGQVIAALGETPKKPTKSLELGDSSLLILTMSEAAEYYGVPSNIIPQRTRVAAHA